MALVFVSIFLSIIIHIAEVTTFRTTAVHNSSRFMNEAINISRCGYISSTQKCHKMVVASLDLHSATSKQYLFIYHQSDIYCITTNYRRRVNFYLQMLTKVIFWHLVCW